MKTQPDRVIYSKRKTLGLEITQAGELIVRAPKRTSQRAIAALINAHQSWIEKTLQTHANRQPEPDTFYFLGEAYSLSLVDSAEHPLTLSDQFYLLKTYQDKRTDVLTHWYKQQAKIHIIDRAKQLAMQHRFSVKAFRLSNAKTYWGICSADNVLRFQWRLVKAPQALIDYVIYHELAHTQEKNHSKSFWQLVHALCPNYQSYETQLKKWCFG